MSVVVFQVILICGPFDGERDLWLVSEAADDLPEQLIAWRCSGRDCNPGSEGHHPPHVALSNAAEDPRRLGAEYTRIDYDVAWHGFGGHAQGEARYVHAELNLEDVLATSGMAHA